MSRLLLRRPIRHNRRDFLRTLLFSAGAVSAGQWLAACGDSPPPAAGPGPGPGPVNPPAPTPRARP